MPVTNEMIKGCVYSDEMASGIRMRSGLMVLLSSSAVAFAFGMSFYFALVSSETAVATQFPELTPVVTKLKSLLVINTIGFVAVVIASFWFLSRIVSSRMFVPLGIVMTGLRKAAENRYPETDEPRESGPFGDLEATWNIAVHGIREREKHEICALENSLVALSGPGAGEARATIEKLIEEKKRRICVDVTGCESGSPGSSGTDDALFMQPV